MSSCEGPFAVAVGAARRGRVSEPLSVKKRRKVRLESFYHQEIGFASFYVI